MRKLSLVFVCAIFALSGCVKDTTPTPAVDPIAIPEGSRTVTLPNGLEDGVLSVGEFVVKTFTANEAWVIDPATVPEWCTVEPMSGDKGEITVKFIVAQENATWMANTADVVVKPVSGVSGSVTVNQPGISEGTIYVSTAGTLEAEIEELEVVNPISLKILGNLNAEDFAVLNAKTTLEKLDLQGAVLENNAIPDQAFMSNATLRVVELPVGLKSIGVDAFKNCISLSSISALPSGLTTIGASAFEGCAGLTGSLTLPAELTAIGASAFKGCIKLSGSLIIPASVNLGASAFYGCSGFKGTLTLESGRTAIAEHAFRDCSGFTGELIIPEGMITIGLYAFKGCSGFTGTLTIPSTLTIVELYLFRGCTGIDKVIVSEGVTTIKGYAFTDCTGIANIVLPATISSLATNTFSNCTGLRAFRAKMATPVGKASLIFGSSTPIGSVDLYVPTGSLTLYNTSWSGFGSCVGE